MQLGFKTADDRTSAPPPSSYASLPPSVGETLHRYLMLLLNGPSYRALSRPTQPASQPQSLLSRIAQSYQSNPMLGYSAGGENSTPNQSPTALQSAATTIGSGLSVSNPTLLSAYTTSLSPPLLSSSSTQQPGSQSTQQTATSPSGIHFPPHKYDWIAPPARYNHREPPHTATR